MINVTWIECLFFQNLDAATNACDAYGQLLAASRAASGAEAASGTPGTPPSSRPGSSGVHHGQRRSSEAEAKDSESSEKSGNAQYLASNRVLITNYDRDAQSAVEEHFNRALSYANNEATEKGETIAEVLKVLTLTFRFCSSIITHSAVNFLKRRLDKHLANIWNCEQYRIRKNKNSCLVNVCSG